MEAKDIVTKEIARQAEFGYVPSQEDFVIAGRQAGVKEVIETTVYLPSIKRNITVKELFEPTVWGQAKLKEWNQ